MTAKFRHTTEEEVYSYVYAYQAARYGYKTAKSEKRGSLFGFMSAIVFSAFTLEAYANHLGPKVLKDWKKLDRNPVKEKLTRIANQVEFTLDYESRPLKTIIKAYGTRNSLAHARTENIRYEGETDDPDFDPFTTSPGAGWQKFCTEDNANKVLEDLNAFITDLHKAAGLGSHPFISAGRGRTSMGAQEES